MARPYLASPLKNADDLRDRSLIEERESTREIIIDFRSIVEAKSCSMTEIAANATFTSLLGRMAYQKKREVTWREMMRTAA